MAALAFLTVKWGLLHIMVLDGLDWIGLELK